jgi:hypothetical protein
MLFTNIQLDDFQPTLARFLERLVIEGAEEREWIMMAIINITAVLEYGKPSGLLRRMGGISGREAAGRVIAKKATPEESKMDIDDDHLHPPQVSPTLSDADSYSPEDPPAFKYALQLTFAMLSYVLRNPTRKATEFSRSSLNPYLPVLLTFLATILKHRPSLSLLERSIPWDDLATFFTSIPRKVMESQHLFSVLDVAPEQRWLMLTSGCTPPLPEDWCMRGMEWVSRKVFERGYWKSGSDRPEIEVLDSQEIDQSTDGQIEDDKEEEKGQHYYGVKLDGLYDVSGIPRNEGWRVSPKETTMKRWTRIVRCAVDIAGVVPGFMWVQGTRDWRVEGKLADKVAAWREMDRMEREDEEKRRMGKRWVDDDELMDVDGEGEEEESSEDDENDSEEVKELKVMFLFIVLSLAAYLIFHYYRLVVATFVASCNRPRANTRMYRRHANRDRREGLRTIFPSSRSFLAIQFSLSTPTSSSRLFLWLFHWLRVASGQLLSPSPSSWNLTVSSTTLPNSVKLRKTPCTTSPLTSVLSPPRSRFRHPRAIT